MRSSLENCDCDSAMQLKSLSKGELLAHISRGLEADLAPKIPADAAPVGCVVTAAQALMIVVPDSATVTAEVSVANLDIGFVNAGQKAEVKLETFPYTKYGTVSATVGVVTADAVTDEKRGSYYPATLTLAKRSMNIDGKQVAISPGMNVTAEIKTGERRVIEYLLSPIQRAGSESLRER